jgi:hypothetical protein
MLPLLYMHEPGFEVPGVLSLYGVLLAFQSPRPWTS